MHLSWFTDTRKNANDSLQNRLELNEAVLRSLIISVGIIGSIIYAVSNITVFWSAVPRLSIVVGVLALTTLLA